MDDPAQISTLVVALGVVLGLAFGAAVHRSNFCAMGAISDVVNMGDWNRMRMWLLAIAVAILGTSALSASGQIDLSRSYYTGERFIWLSYLLGGLLFGVGMTLASGCGSKNLVRLGAGNLKSLVVVIVLGLSAYMALKGALAPLRVHVLDAISTRLDRGQDLPRLFAGGFGIEERAWRWIASVLIATGLLAFVLLDRDFRSNRNAIHGGLVVGLAVVGGWFVTGHLGYMEEHPDTLEAAFLATNSHRPESLSYVGPVAFSLELLLLWTDASLTLTFGIAAIIGTTVGASAHALATGSFRWESFTSAADMRRHLVGGFLMGFGGVTAAGCTIGQGVSGLSTLALGSMLALASIVVGAVVTMKYLYWRVIPTEL